MTRLYKNLIIEILKDSNSRENLLSNVLCYMREELPWEDNIYLITCNKQIFTNFIKALDIIDESRLEELLKDYDICISEGDKQDKVVFCVKTNAEGYFETSITTIDIADEAIQVVPVYVLVEKLTTLLERLKKDEALITYRTPAGFKILHTSLNWLHINQWGHGISEKEWQQMLQLSEEYGDMGEVILPNLDKPYPNYEYINVMDIVEIRLVDKERQL